LRDGWLSLEGWVAKSVGWVVKSCLEGWVAKSAAPACYGSTLGSNPDNPQKS
jgi:hypothetical protein